MKRSLAAMFVCAVLVAGACSDTAGDGTSTMAAGVDTAAPDAASTTAVSTSTAAAETTTTASPSPTTTVAATTSTEASDGSTETTTTLGASGGFPVTVVSDAGPTTIDVPPVRIAALSATHVEMLYALGAGDRIIAVDLFSNFPEEAAENTQLDSFNLNVEEVIATDADLVVLSFDPVGAVDALESVGIPTLLLGTATTIEDAYLQIGVLGSATGLETESEELVADMAADIDAIVAAAGDTAVGVSYYHESDPFTFYTPTSESFIGQIYSLFGMENIADAAPDAAGQTFPQLTPEYIVDSDPQIIYSTDPSGDLSVYTSREGWASMTAVSEGSIAFLDPDIASRWGPRLVDLVSAIASSIVEFVG